MLRLLAYALILLVVIGGAAPIVATPSTDGNGIGFGQVVIFADDQISLKTGSLVKSGDIIVNDTLSGNKDELNIGVAAKVSAGSNVFAQTIGVKNSATVDGTLTCQRVHGEGSGGLECSQFPGTPFLEESLDQSVSLGEFPQFVSGIPGTFDVTVPTGASMVIPPGRYGDWLVGKIYARCSPLAPLDSHAGCSVRVAQ